MKTDKPIHYLVDYVPPYFNVESIDLKIDLHDDLSKVTSTMKIRRHPDGAEQPLFLHGRNQVLEHIVLNGVELASEKYQLTDEGLLIEHVPDFFELVIKTTVDPANNTSLMGLYKSGGNYCTQCESDGFRKITYYFDRPDVLAEFTTTITADKKQYPSLLANGNLVREGDQAGGRHFATWHDPFKKPCYLFAMVAGSFEVITDYFVTCSGRKVTLKIFASKQAIDRCHYAMEALKQSMRWDEEAFGREYDLDIFMIVAVNDFNFGAMENKGLNIFNDKYILVDPKTATDNDYALIDAVVGHEYFHNWSGNRVTLRDWFQLSLKEGLTVFRDQSFSEYLGSAALERITQVRRLRSAQFPEDAGPLAHPVRPESYIEMNNFYTMTVYEKGAEVIRMLKMLLGAEDFRKACDDYFATFDGQAVTCEDFLSSMEKVSGKDLSQFKRWYYQSGTPLLTIKAHYDAAAKEYTLDVKQETLPTTDQQEKQTLHIPLAMGLLDEKGREVPLKLKNSDDSAATTLVLDVTEARQSFVFVDVDGQPTPSFLRGFSAPVKLTYDYSDEALAFLMQHDPDAFSRWDASQQLATRALLSVVNTIQINEPIQAPVVYKDAVEALLQDDATDQALLAEMMTLPSERTVADQMDVVDVDAIHEARRFLRGYLAESLKDAWLAHYQHNAVKQPYSYNQKDAAKRLFKNTCLVYLTALTSQEIQALSEQQFQQADNMTDSMAALSAAVSQGNPNAQAMLQAFFDQWQHEPLVLDKWLIVQACSAHFGTLEKVRKLCEHPAFSMKNPNKVRSLLGVFAKDNLSQFHVSSGEGYSFIADKVLEVDALNPSVASRVVEPLVQWRRFDVGRQALMKAQLIRILNHPNLSGGTYEIVSKSINVKEKN